MSSRQNSRFDGGSDESSYYRRNSSQSQNQSSQYQKNYYNDSSTSRQQQSSHQIPSYPPPSSNYQNQMAYQRPPYQAPYGYQHVPQQYPPPPPAQMQYDPRMSYGGVLPNQAYHQGYTNLQQQYWAQNQAAVPTPVPKPTDPGMLRQPPSKSEGTIPARAVPSSAATSSKRSYDDSRRADDAKGPSSSSQRVSTSGNPQAKREEEKEIKKAVPIMVGKRRGGRVLPTGVVKKQRPDSTTEGRTDAWGQYMAEVQKYKAQSCEEERKNRPLVK